MIEKFQRVSGIGLFCDAQEGANLPLQRLTLIYGENARGKSTLSAILGSARANAPSVLTDRATIDSTVNPYVSISRSDGSSLTFEQGAWKGDASDFEVFDSEFIENNVHSGHEVNSDHRKNLLSFALGEKAVMAEAQERSATQAAKDLKSELDLAVQKLLTKSDGMSEDEFTSLVSVANVDAEIVAADASVKAAESRRAILNQPLPDVPTVPNFSLDSVFEVLRNTLESAHATAERIVVAHLRSRPDSQFEEWLADGQKYVGGEDCPYCGQAITDRSLVDSYKIHFNEAYKNLRQSVIDKLKMVENATASEAVETFAQTIDSAIIATKNWRESGVVVNMPGVSDRATMTGNLDNVRTKLLALLEKKRSDLDWSEYKLEDEKEIRRSWESYWREVKKEELVVKKTRESIEAFKLGLEKADVNSEKSKLRNLQLSKIRYSDDVVDEIATIADLRKDHASAEAARKRARIELKNRMDETLSEFSDEINKYLAMQYASFRVDQLASNYKGGSPRTDYGILLRERAVNLSGAQKSFRTALSESDKRAMAFSFFLASTLSDPELHQKIIVVDDPMSSFDRNRRSATVKILRDLAPKCAQLIVIAHDPQFLLEIDNGWGDFKVLDSSGQKVWIRRSHLKLVAKVLNPALEPYTDFEECDLPRECESKYAKNYRIVSDFVADPSGDGHAAAGAIRPLLEGFLHRRYPNLLPENCMFGKAVTAIENADATSPLAGARHLVPEMRRIAFFGGDPHHDTRPDFPWGGLSTIEIHGFARDVLSIVHGDR
ncbi:AAA family ATPase [Brevibacterium limosum]|uniref:AAA family ATPase n=1 Tax=Brevibacterium limosum TaxID=2697565 RepID=UPI001421075D|nr:AAA family ATPase [Brevibacterium limosum]